MKKSAFVLAALSALSTVLHAESGRIMRASFPDGTGVEIFTEATGATQIDAEGVMGIGPGAGSKDLVDRIVKDRANNILFAYNLEASRGASPDTVMIRIEPIGPATETMMLEDFGPRTGLRFAGAHFPTVAGVREFPAVKIGEVVTLDILYNPSTGEKIYDVLRPIAGSSPGMSVRSVPAVEMISLKQIAIRVNGKAMSAPASWMIGAAVRIDVPGHGAWVLAAADPHAASPDRVFNAIAHADGKAVSWAMDGVRVEITSGTDVLTWQPASCWNP